MRTLWVRMAEIYGHRWTSSYGDSESGAARTWAKGLAGVSPAQLAAGLADRCEVQVSYAIGVAEPTSISVETFGTGKVSNETLTALVKKHFDLRPKGIIEMLDLQRPIYAKTAAYGHFGRNEPEFTWEQTDKAAALKAAAGM